ncbi:bifunctional [glutamine synthetase] adenylyltransferase/[glutamine synthetase]-adenylyl-L-tyrosine phosphorylase [Caulobacter sp. S45]|uniref:bifunctional [glutamine synthetase] adenylyltransferase/[glutamine synthetase]-adenylyl-L-tyrosine phosphorylase n=1 Tax=Caulobacter sp. S45 TaxID=1641861 RepID=UPI00131C5FF6|nr:bifunctional [glutamine synthetase] adenylyltransferase/[glutamine synthetase]-adenylyl-L-tyrosine phosphorylase [Caulobacter sp. S45]
MPLVLHPCGPIVDATAARRARERLGPSTVIDGAWPELEPVFAASPYLARLAVRSSARLETLLRSDPDAHLEDLIARTTAVALATDVETAGRELRRLKAELHLLTALCDLGGRWDLDRVTSALTRFADAAVQAGLSVVTAQEHERGRLVGGVLDAGPLPGLFCLALGKHGGFELNYSSDIDISVFYEPSALPVAVDVDPRALAERLTKALAALLQERTAEGYVFRVDLRLRPDPSSTPVAMPVEAALTYYETAGQNWERAAMIKARACAGDLARGQAFIDSLRPFIWRRSLDYAAIADIGAIKRQIHVHKVDERLVAPGHNLKLGAGGIREIEFFVQTQQLILGGRDRSLRSPRTLDALAALAAAGHVTPDACTDLTDAYRRLRGWEHRAQMIADEQTHTLPEDPTIRRAIGALSGAPDLATFDREVGEVLERVNARYAALFAEDEDLSTAFGSLVFTGVEDDPETLLTLKRMGFSNPAQVSAAIRGWHHGRVPATRGERARELFTRLVPRLLEAAHASGAPDNAFNRFADFFAALGSGVQVQSLFLAKPELLELVVRVMAFAPELARILARRPEALDALLDARFFAPLDPAEAAEALHAAVDRAPGFEAAMDAARRAHHDQAFRIGVQVMSGAADAWEAGRSFAALADACLGALAPAALAETERLGGDFLGDVAVVALGRAGSREMTARSDLDLMTVFRTADPTVLSAGKGWSGETFYARFSQRLTTALSASTPAGGLYEVDLQLRPSGAAGPIAVSLNAFRRYYAEEAETWEALALTRARVAWASSEAFAIEATTAIVQALRRPRAPAAVSRDVLDMRRLMSRERPPKGEWDLKLCPGGLVDIEFAAQALQVVHASRGGPLLTNTGSALVTMRDHGLADPATLDALWAAWNLEQNLWQLLKLALPDGADPADEPQRFRTLLARAGGCADFDKLKKTLEARRREAHAAFIKVVKGLAL